MSFDRARGCLLGMAVGEALGALPAGLADPLSVPLVLEPPLQLRGATSAALAVADGLLHGFEGTVDPDQVAQRVSSRLLRWYVEDDRMAEPSTRAVLAAWPARDSRHIPAQLVARAAPVGLAWTPERVPAFAAAVTRATHTHPSAIEAAILFAWLVSHLVRGEGMSAGLAREGARQVHGFGLGGGVRAVVDRALSLPTGPVLPVSRIPPGDGGRSVLSSLALAILATVGEPGFGLAIERAVRIRGDAASVGALAGALAGATAGLRGLPASFVDPLPARELAITLADGLLEQGAVRPPHPHAPAVERLGFSRSELAMDAGDPEWLEADAVDAAQAVAHAALSRPPEPEATSWIEEGLPVDAEALFLSWKDRHGVR